MSRGGGPSDPPPAPAPSSASDSDETQGKLDVGPADLGVLDLSEVIELQDRLGWGGQGDIVRAYDHRLGRPLAVKLLRAEDPADTARLLREAQAQARVDHPHVCKVYGIGHHAGRPMIALQLIDGKTLEETLPEMTRAERLTVMSQVARGVEAAHRTGLVHRDLKPQNVLVERRDAGWHAYVVDFGLARELDHQTLQVVSGTPHYMAPEQVRGVAADRRTDVWGLGATLYRLLCGHPPFAGPHVDAVLYGVVNDEVTPPRRIDPTIPRDLELIVLRCLEKDRERRYPTAGELGDDLERYLKGEPIAARPPSFFYRLGKRAWKQRVPLVASASALAMAVAAAALLWRASAQGAELARRTEEYTRDVAQFETLMQKSAQLPLHDADAEREVVRLRMEQIAGELPRMTRRARGVAHLAIGRGALATEDYERAQVELEAAWAEGYRASDASLALGRALAERYQAALDDARSGRTGPERARLEGEAARRFREPALLHLRRAQQTPLEAPELVAARIAFIEGKLDEALAQALAAKRRLPWLYEADRQRGEVELQKSRVLWDGGDVAGAQTAASRAAEAVASALAVAPSDGGSRALDCRCRGRALQISHLRSRLTAALLAAARGACEDALRVSPSRAGVWHDLAGAWAMEALDAREHGRDPREAFDRAIATAEEAARLGRDARIFGSLTSYLLERADLAVAHGEDARGLLGRAVAAGEHAAEIDPQIGLVRLGGALAARGEDEVRRGNDPRRDFARAVAAARRSAILAPSSWTVQNDVGNVLDIVAQWESRHGLDPRASSEEALRAFARVRQLNGEADFGFLNACLGLIALVRFELETGGDGAARLAEARNLCEENCRIDPAYAQSHAMVAEVALLEMQADRLRDQRVAGRAAQARQALARARRIDPRSSLASAVEVELALTVARDAAAHGRRPDLGAIETALSRARALDRPPSRIARLAAELAILRAELALARYEPVARIVEEGLRAARETGPAAPEPDEALLLAGQLHLMAARAARGAERRALAEEAGRELSLALTRNANLRYRVDRLRDEARRLADSIDGPKGRG